MSLANLSNLPLRRTWTRRDTIIAALLVLAGFAVTFDAWRDMLRIAIKDEESSHAFLVPIAVAWLVWVRRGRLRHCGRRGAWLGLVLVMLGWFLHSYGDTQQYQSLWHGGALMVVIGCLVCVIGAEALWHLLPAFIVMFFIVPFPGRFRQQLAIPMATVTAQITEQLFLLFGVPIERSGNLLSINRTDVTIAEACNGLRMVLALFLVSFTFTFGSPLRWYTRLLILAAAPVSAIFFNVVRMVPTVLAYGYFPPVWADRVHTLGGWVMLVVAFLALLGIIRLLRWALVPVNQYTLAYD